MIKINSFFYLSLIIIIGCNTSEPKSSVKEFYKNGQLFKEYSVSRNKQIDGVYKEYYTNGKVKKLYNYLNGKLEGEQKDYFESGVLKSKGFYINSILDSLIYHYYPNSSMMMESFRFEGKLFGSQKEFDSGGKLKSMFFMVNDSDWISSLVFDKNGDVIKKEGSLIYCITEKKNITIKDTPTGASVPEGTCVICYHPVYDWH